MVIQGIMLIHDNAHSLTLSQYISTQPSAGITVSSPSRAQTLHQAIFMLHLKSLFAGEWFCKDNGSTKPVTYSLHLSTKKIHLGLVIKVTQQWEKICGT